MLWKCSVCGYTTEGGNAPEKCPKCGSPSEKYSILPVEDADKIYAADRTNDIHMKIEKQAALIIQLCEEGLEIDLDPGCNAVFSNSKQLGWTVKQMCKAEIATHVAKGKW